MKKSLIISVWLIFAFVIPVLSKDWLGIVPLHSTREDLERVIKAKLVRCGGNACLYDLADKTVFALYAAEPTCRNDDATTSWNVPANTVIEITIHFKTPQPQSVLNIDLAKYERVEDKELRGLVYFYNYADGIEIETSGDTIRRLTYFHAEKDSHLRCPKKP